MIKIGMVGTHQLSFPGEKENLYGRMRKENCFNCYWKE